MRDETKRILVGKIAGLYGVKGWLKIMSYTRPRENLLGYSPWQVKLKGEWHQFTAGDGKVHGKGLIATFKDITDRESARAYVGADIMIERSQLQPLAAGEYYEHDLLDMQVINRQGDVLGRLTKIVETGANDVLIVEGKGRHLIPLIWHRHIIGVDEQQGIIRVDWEITE